MARLSQHADAYALFLFVCTCSLFNLKSLCSTCFVLPREWLAIAFRVDNSLLHHACLQCCLHNTFLRMPSVHTATRPVLLS